MKRPLLAAAAVAVACTVGAASPTAAPPAAAADVEHLVAELERIHPRPYHAVTRERYRAAADGLVKRLASLSDDELLVELMRLVALLGERDGHASLHPLNTAHRRRMHLYPLVPYTFSDGVYVAAAPGRPALVGMRIVAVQGRPLADVLELVDPLVPRDNRASLEAHRGPYLVTAEVLHGLGVTPDAGRATFTLETRAGRRTDVALSPIGPGAYTTSVKSWYPLFVDGMPKRPRPLFVSRKQAGLWLTTLDRGHVVYLAYNSTMFDTWPASQRLLRLSRAKKVRRVVIDLRNNGGGDIGTYPPLLDVLRSRSINRPGRLVVLIGRTTFSASVHFALDVERATRATLIGETAGGSPNHYSDTSPVDLPVTGYQIGWPRIYYEKRPGEPGRTLEPDVRVPLTGADFFAGHDPVLARALR